MKVLFRGKKGLGPLLPIIFFGGMLVLGYLFLKLLWRIVIISAWIVGLVFLGLLVYWGYMKFVKKEEVHFKMPEIVGKMKKFLVTGTIWFFIILYFIMPDFVPGPIDDAIVAAIGIYANKFITKKM